ncbi:hypothetical protein DUNSADRAFT_13732 [Dunaliella salina]|uniref:Encoded protein n=1 Tax=Dunaliella salina TaxID=3046 RepID=A0ABQ7H336_DUNSA|nr:hypothetical protein DUNSADRAFT_13732 [Dunaliella salina]|eukprot:KAF5841278.1 hypothetical protein DUNSADRAFT_13732 [Dunaliella salina]
MDRLQPLAALRQSLRATLAWRGKRAKGLCPSSYRGNPCNSVVPEPVWTICGRVLMPWMLNLVEGPWCNYSSCAWLLGKLCSRWRGHIFQKVYEDCRASRVVRCKSSLNIGCRCWCECGRLLFFIFLLIALQQCMYFKVYTLCCKLATRLALCRGALCLQFAQMQLLVFPCSCIVFFRPLP